MSSLDKELSDILLDDRLVSFLELGVDRAREKLKGLRKPDFARVVKNRKEAKETLNQLKYKIHDFLDVREEIPDPRITMGWMQNITGTLSWLPSIAAVPATALTVYALPMLGEMAYQAEDIPEKLVFYGGTVFYSGLAVLGALLSAYTLSFLRTKAGDYSPMINTIRLPGKKTEPKIIEALVHEYTHHLQSEIGFKHDEEFYMNKLTTEGNAKAATSAFLQENFPDDPAFKYMTSKGDLRSMNDTYLFVCNRKNKKPGIQVDKPGKSGIWYHQGYCLMNYLQSRIGNEVHGQVLKEGPEEFLRLLKSN